MINRILTDKAKIYCYYGHSASVKTNVLDLYKNPVIVNTHAIYIENKGRKTANKVKVGHIFLPDFQIFPSKQYNINLLPDGSHEVEIENILPKELIVINYLYFPPSLYNEINTYVTYEEGYAKIVNVQLTIKFPKYVELISWFLILTGIATLLYFGYSSIKGFLIFN
jgi:hypothetical protein